MSHRATGTGNLYLAAETGTVRKNWRGKISVALVYPNTYYVGMSNLGYQTVYGLINAFEDIVCERVFVPDDASHMARGLRSVESKRSLTDFDIVAFSTSFENDYPNLLSILEAAGLPLRASDRSPPHPLIIAGGVTSLLNPEPLAPFVDCFLIGEAEALLPAFFGLYRDCSDRTELLRALAVTVEGAYVPAFYDVTYASDGTIERFRPAQGVPSKVKRAVAEDLSSYNTCSTVLTARTTFGKTYLIEGARGCPHGCRFCAAGYVYRPPRFRTASQLEEALQCAGRQAKSIGLVAAAVADIPSLEAFCAKAIDCRLGISFSSLRADLLTEPLLRALGRTGTKTVTIAPDAGSERLRCVINKGITEKDVLQAVDLVVHAGIPNLKLYFMVGLPTETMSDVDEIVALCKKVKHGFLRASRSKARIGEIVVSLNCFVPKPFTPFQWVPMEDVRVLKDKIRCVKDGLRRVANVKVHADVPRWAYVQALLSRGDRRIALVLAAVKKSESNWPKILKESVVNPDFFVYRQRPLDERLPWDFIDHGVKKAFLAEEYEKALRAEPTTGCHVGRCKACGVCD